jgi:hypothetical protein
MIAKEQMLPMLVQACPTFADKWNEHKQEYHDEKDFLPYVALGEFARHLIELEKQNQTNDFEKIFELIETFHLEGDPYVKEAATIGLLESLQNNLGNEMEKFVKFLKPESLKWWDELNKFWNGEIQFVGQTVNGKS